MSITSIPLQTESAGQLGKSKSDGTGVYDADTKIAAAQWNQVVLRLISAFQEIGLTDGSTVGSLREAINAVIAGGIDVAAALLANVADLDFADVNLTGIGNLDAGDTTLDTLTVIGAAEVQGALDVGGVLNVVGGIPSDPWKAVVRLASTANATLATAFENGDSLDGKTLATGDRILIWKQTTTEENGIYVVNASGAPTRAGDWNAAGDLARGGVVFVSTGDKYGGYIFTARELTITPGSTGVVWFQHAPVGRDTDTTVNALAVATAITGLTGAPLSLQSDDDMILYTSGALNISAANGIDVANKKIGSLADPASVQDAANRRYADQPTTRTDSTTTPAITTADIGGILILSNAGAITLTTLDLSASLRSGGAIPITVILTGGGTLSIADGSGCTHAGSPSGTSAFLCTANGTTWLVR